MFFIKLLLIMGFITQSKCILKEKVVYQMDVSEHCRRRVMPSIFLARNVIDASAYILHLSQMELPYTCFISVRTESGSNIIMVIKMLESGGFIQSCKENNPELLVYEMGETFGGYWGPLPDNIMKQRPSKSKYYTLKTTRHTTTKKETASSNEPKSSTEETPITLDVKQDFSLSQTQSTEDYIAIEIPLLNVSAQLVPSDGQSTKPVDIDETFDINYDVTPIPGVKYDTSLIPLVQFSINERPDASGARDGKPRYDLDVVRQFPMFTSDNRRTMHKKFQNDRQHVNRRLNFNKNKTRRRKLPKGPIKTNNIITTYIFPTTDNFRRKSKTLSTYSWDYIQEFLGRMSKAHTYNESKSFSNAETLLQNISDTKHNFSLYLSPNLFKDSLHSITESILNFNYSITADKIYNAIKNVSTVTKKSTDVLTKNNTSVFNSTIETNGAINSNKTISGIKNVTLGIHVNKTWIINTTPQVSMVDRESWENVVQAAPKMAVLLNNTNDTSTSNRNIDTIHISNETDLKSELILKSKREIHAIDIENARPHNVTKRPPKVTIETTFGLEDMQDFAQLVEIQDDDLYGRVALRYLRHYVGPVFYNVCDLSMGSNRHVHLFNSSRIVLAITNFTHFSRMTLVLTATRTLVAGEARCPDTNIECQVSGARVCVDAMTACDGVPNCGSYDIYDEDRLKCGASQGLEHNVYIAAFTFLAVLLTALYAVHYWLKRCVPKVADAFFTYSNGVENILYLDSVMRSPHDTGESSSFFYNPGIFNDFDDYDKRLKINLCSRLYRLCLGLCRRKKNNDITQDIDGTREFKRMYSFTEFQIQKIAGKTVVETSVQTGDSLELSNLEGLKKKGKSKPGKSTDSPIIIQDSLLTLEEPFPEDYTDELSLLKFFKSARRDSLDSTIAREHQELLTKDDIKSGSTFEEEKEIKNLIYDQSAVPGPSGIKHRKKETKVNVSKRLRFDEMTTTIPSIDENLEEIDNPSVGRRHSVFLDSVTGKAKQFLGTIEEDDESIIGSKEHKHFWKLNKGKKSKKNTQTLLR